MTKFDKNALNTLFAQAKDSVSQVFWAENTKLKEQLQEEE